MYCCELAGASEEHRGARYWVGPLITACKNYNTVWILNFLLGGLLKATGILKRQFHGLVCRLDHGSP